MTTLPPIPRPHGGLYRPRKLTVGTWDNEGAYDRDGWAGWAGWAGCYVLGTHDIDTARPLAEEECRFTFGTQYVIKPQRVWIRDGFESGERRWVHDERRGRAAVQFVASDDPDTSTGVTA